MPDPTSTPLRILIVRLGAMGDVLHALPAVTALRTAYPDIFIGWAVDPAWLPLLQAPDGNKPLVNLVHLVETRTWKRHPLAPSTPRQILTLRRELHAQHYDLALDLQGSLKSAVITRLSGAPQRLGPQHPRESPARFFYTCHIPHPAPNVIDQAAQLVSAAVHLTLKPAPIQLPTGPAPSSEENFMLLAPTAGWGAKEWGTANYVALANALQAQGHRVLINTAPTPSPIAIEVAQNSGATLAPSTLPQLMALTRRAALVIGGDTGPVHLAAALGRPTLALFGPTDPARNGPAFPNARTTVLRNPASLTSHKRLPHTEPGLARIKVDQVLAAALALLTTPEGV